MERFVARGDGGRRARPVDRARVQPGPRGDDGRARPPERGRGRVRRHLHEPRPQPRRRHPRTRSTSSSRSPARAAPARRSRTSTCATTRARPTAGGSGRSSMMAAAREAGPGRARRHDAVPRRPRPAVRDPAAVGGGRRRGGGARAPARPRDAASGCGPSATATGASSTRASGTACACRRARSIPSWDGLTFAQIAELREGRPVGLLLRRPRGRGRPRTRASSSSATLFTDEHLAEMISHPLFCLGVDTFTVTREGPLADVLRHPLGYAGHVHYLTHHVRENGTLRARGGDPEDDEHAGGALRPLGPGPAPGRLRGRRGRLRLRRARRRLDDRRPAPLRARRRARARQRRRSSSTAASTPARGRAGTCCALRLIDLRSDLCSVPTERDVGGDAEGRARLGDRRRGRLGERALRARGGAARQAGGGLGARRAGWRTSSRCSTFCEPGDHVVLEAASHVLTSEAMGIVEIARLEPAPVWAADGRMEPDAVEELDRASAVPPCSSSRTRTRGPAARRSRRS